MRYMGSKRRIIKDIRPILVKDRKIGQAYCEPFCGGCNSLSEIEGPRIGVDINGYIISMWQRLQDGWKPPTDVSESMYRDVKLHRDKYPPELVGFVGFGCSFGGKWFGGYARGKNNRGISRNYAEESQRHLVRQIDKLQGVLFREASYKRCHWPAQSILYCDPPYQGTQGYGGGWDAREFWTWCDVQIDAGHSVFVSEYKAPDSWDSIWSKKIGNTLDLNTGSKYGVECLFSKRR